MRDLMCDVNYSPWTAKRLYWLYSVITWRQRKKISFIGRLFNDYSTGATLCIDLDSNTQIEQ